MIKVICKVCSKEFNVFPYRIKRKYCSKECQYIARKEFHQSKETKIKIGLSHKGKKHSREHIIKFMISRSRGGIKKHQGYIFIKKWNHPFRSPNGYVKRSHLIMEESLGRYLKTQEVVHHINKVRDDDRPENLMLFENTGEHTRFHNLIKYSKPIVNNEIKNINGVTGKGW